MFRFLLAFLLLACMCLNTEACGRRGASRVRMRGTFIMNGCANGNCAPRSMSAPRSGGCANGSCAVR